MGQLALVLGVDMLWNTSDADRFTKKAHTPYVLELWAKNANEALGQYKSEARATKVYNIMVNKPIK
jgi:hypothetical protein